jgi:hypothetical protein
MTAPNTTKMNGVMERSFVTCRDRAFANMLAARFYRETQGILWAEVVTTATKIGNMMATKGQTNSPFEKWYGKDKNKSISEFLQSFGRVTYVTVRTKADPEEVHTKINQLCDGGLCR